MFLHRQMMVPPGGFGIFLSLWWFWRESCSPVGWNPGPLPWRPGFPGHPTYLTAAPPKLWVPWFGYNAVLITQVHFWLSLVTIDIHAYIFYLQSVLFARCFEVSFGPARLVVICPHPHPLARSGAVVGHQLCIKVTVSNKCLLIFFFFFSVLHIPLFNMVFCSIYIDENLKQTKGTLVKTPLPPPALLE